MNGQLHLHAVDAEDGEVISVEDVEVGEESLTFTLVTESTNWTVNKEIKPEENGSLRCITTTVESWERIA